jgi:hypothetical protein
MFESTGRVFFHQPTVASCPASSEQLSSSIRYQLIRSPQQHRFRIQVYFESHTAAKLSKQELYIAANKETKQKG